MHGSNLTRWLALPLLSCALTAQAIPPPPPRRRNSGKRR